MKKKLFAATAAAIAAIAFWRRKTIKDDAARSLRQAKARPPKPQGPARASLPRRSSRQGCGRQGH
jgi:hypothetical protein